MDLDELCVAILHIFYGIPYLYEFGGVYDDIFFRNMWYLLIPFHMLVFAILAVSTTYYEMLLKDKAYAREHFHILPFILAVLFHATGWTFLGRSDPTRGMAIGAHILLILGHGFIQIAAKLRKPWSWLPVGFVSAASGLVYVQRRVTGNHWMTVFNYFRVKRDTGVDLPFTTTTGLQTAVLPVFVLTSDALLAVFVLGGLLSYDPPAVQRTRESDVQIRQHPWPRSARALRGPPRPWWQFIDDLEERCSRASWWTGLGTVPCDHGYRQTGDRITCAQAQELAMIDGITRCVCCKVTTNMFFSEYLALLLFCTSVMLTGTQAIADQELMLNTQILKYVKLATFAFLWVPHYFYTCPVTDRELRKRYVFAYWCALLASSCFHHISVSNDYALPRWCAMFTDWVVVGLMPETLSDSVAHFGLRGSAHKKAMTCVMFSSTCVIALLLVYRSYLPGFQLTSILLTIVGFKYPAMVVLDKIQFVEAMGRRVYTARESSQLSEDWWLKRPQPIQHTQDKEGFVDDI